MGTSRLAGLSLALLAVGEGLIAQAGPFQALPKPTLVIGTEGNPDYEFVNIVAIHRLPDGAVAVGDYQTQTPTIRIYDSQGRLLRKLGRLGEGPGEFRGLSALLQSGDTLIVFDSRLLRLTRYLAGGTLLGTQPVRTDAVNGRVYITGRLASGRWLVTTPHQPNWSHGPGIYRDTLRVGTLDPSSTGSVRWAGDFPGATLFAYLPAEKSRWVAGWAFVSPNTLVRVAADTIIVGDTAVPELQYLRSDGRLIRGVALPLGAPPDLSRQRAAARDEGLALDRTGSNKAYAQALYEAPRPTPRYRSFIVAADGTLWIRLWEEDPADPPRYLILSSEGNVRARVSLPPRSEVLSVQGPWIAVVLKDEDDVERVGLIRWAP